ncbi:hypothetical protein AAHC03_01793 [Spirometra sp. Aus1]
MIYASTFGCHGIGNRRGVFYRAVEEVAVYCFKLGLKILKSDQLLTACGGSNIGSAGETFTEQTLVNHFCCLE